MYMVDINAIETINPKSVHPLEAISKRIENFARTQTKSKPESSDKTTDVAEEETERPIRIIEDTQTKDSLHERLPERVQERKFRTTQEKPKKELQHSHIAPPQHHSHSHERNSREKWHPSFDIS